MINFGRVFRCVVPSAALVLFGIAGGFSCANSRTTSSQRLSASSASDAAKDSRSPRAAFGEHWVQDAEVRALMQRMARGNTAWPDDLPEDPEGVNRADPSQAYAEAATLADLLAQIASDIPQAIAHKSLPDAKRKGFIKEAEALQRHALELKEAARAGKVEQMQRALDRINTTCFACHSQYRDLSGDLNRASLKAAVDPAISLDATSRR
jgi:hypothetical protein